MATARANCPKGANSTPRTAEVGLAGRRLGGVDATLRGCRRATAPPQPAGHSAPDSAPGGPSASTSPRPAPRPSGAAETSSDPSFWITKVAALTLTASGICARTRASASATVRLSRATIRAICVASEATTTTSGANAEATPFSTRSAASSQASGSPRSLTRGALGAQHRDPRMRDDVQAPADLGVREDHRGQGLSVERPVRGEHRVAEGLADLAGGLASRQHDLAREHVGVDDGEPAGSQPRRDRALARRDATGEAEDVHGQSLEVP